MPMMDDWVYNENGGKLEISHKAIDSYFNSDKNGQQYMVGKLFGYVQMLTKQVNENTVEIHRLKERIRELESENE